MQYFIGSQDKTLTAIEAQEAWFGLQSSSSFTSPSLCSGRGENLPCHHYISIEGKGMMGLLVAGLGLGSHCGMENFVPWWKVSTRWTTIFDIEDGVLPETFMHSLWVKTQWSTWKGLWKFPEGAVALCTFLCVSVSMQRGSMQTSACCAFPCVHMHTLSSHTAPVATWRTPFPRDSFPGCGSVGGLIGSLKFPKLTRIFCCILSKD